MGVSISPVWILEMTTNVSESERDTDRKIDRQIDWQIDGQIDGQKERQIERQIDRNTHHAIVSGHAGVNSLHYMLIFASTKWESQVHLQLRYYVSAMLHCRYCN
jgi:primosomal replication protein N